MTTFEHAMLGINGALAVGLHRRFGWQIVAMSGFAAVSPDWDGLTIIVSPTAFAEGHRVYGHNLLACVLLGILIGMLDSGSKTLPDWELKLLWPFSDQGFVYPMVSWGDVGITLIFIAGMFAMFKWKNRLQPIAAITLFGVAAYIVIRGMIAGR